MVHESRRQIYKSVGATLRQCVFGILAASVLVPAAQAQTTTTTVPTLADTVSLTMAMRMRENVSATLPVKALAAYPSLNDKQKACVKVASVGPMVSSYATAIRKALTKDEVTRARTFYTSVEGKSYISKILSATQLNPTSIAPAVTLTATEQTVLNSFLATTAGQKLIKNKSYVTATLNTEVSGHTTLIVKGCPA
jgi:hypothetical protein